MPKFTESLHIPWYVVLTAVMVVLACGLRLLAYVVEGHDDEVITQVLTAMLALFTGSFAVARGISNVNGNGHGKNKEEEQ